MCSRQPTAGFVVSKIKQNIFFCTNSHFFNGLTTTRKVDPLPLYRDFHGLSDAGYPQSYNEQFNQNLLSLNHK
jgi:hypothetical protein